MGNLSLRDGGKMKRNYRRYSLAKMIHGFLSTGLMVGLILFTTSSSPAEESLPAIVKRIEPSVVVIVTYNTEGRVAGQGTGFFVNKEGDLVTNYHVLQGATRADAKTVDGKTYPITTVLADDRVGDLVRVSVNMRGDPVVPLFISSVVPEVGERIIVVGTPLGLEKTVSDGIVSAIRDIPDFGKIVQLTAPISPGSSGSPVLTMEGKVIGIVTFFSAAGQNLNFAVPAERITKLIPGEKVKTLVEWGEADKEEQLAMAENLYAAGLRYLWIEDYVNALRFFVESIKRNPDNAQTYFQIGYCHAKLGRYPDAIEAYQVAIRIQPEDVDPYVNLCEVYGLLGRYDEAIASCKRAIQVQGDLAEAYNNLGWIYQKQGKYQESIDSSKKALELKPGYALAYYNLGNSYASLGRYPEAAEAFKQTIRYKPDHAWAHLNLGASYNQMGRYENAVESYKQAIRFKPEMPEAHLNMGMTYLKLGDKSSALDEYKILKELDKDLANRLFNLIYE